MLAGSCWTRSGWFPTYTDAPIAVQCGSTTYWSSWSCCRVGTWLIHHQSRHGHHSCRYTWRPFGLTIDGSNLETVFSPFHQTVPRDCVSGGVHRQPTSHSTPWLPGTSPQNHISSSGASREWVPGNRHTPIGIDSRTDTCRDFCCGFYRLCDHQVRPYPHPGTAVL